MTLAIKNQGWAKASYEARQQRIERNQYGKRKAIPITKVVIINRTQGRRITYG